MLPLEILSDAWIIPDPTVKMASSADESLSIAVFEEMMLEEPAEARLLNNQPTSSSTRVKCSYLVMGFLGILVIPSMLVLLFHYTNDESE